METRVIRISPENPDRSTLKAVARMLVRGDLCVLPTDTIYGFHCRADLDEAVRQVQAIKGRQEPKPMVVLIPGLDFFQRWNISIPAGAQLLMDRFWPGPLTLVLPCPASVFPLITGGTGSIALRWPGYPVLNKILQFTGSPLISSSVNQTGEKPLHDPSHILEQFGGSITCLVDAGLIPVRKASTIVSFADGTPRLLREGEIPADFIRHIIPGLS